MDVKQVRPMIPKRDGRLVYRRPGDVILHGGSEWVIKSVNESGAVARKINGEEQMTVNAMCEPSEVIRRESLLFATNREKANLIEKILALTRKRSRSELEKMEVPDLKSELEKIQ